MEAKAFTQRAIGKRFKHNHGELDSCRRPEHLPSPPWKPGSLPACQQPGVGCAGHPSSGGMWGAIWDGPMGRAGVAPGMGDWLSLGAGGAGMGTGAWLDGLVELWALGGRGSRVISPSQLG